MQKWIGAQREPAWLGVRRREAGTAEADLELPRWDRTDISGLDLAALRAPGGRIQVHLPPQAAQAGVVAGEVSTLGPEHQEVAAAEFGRLVPVATGKLEARNAALGRVVLVLVPPGVALEQPIELVYELPSDPGAQLHTRTLVLLGRGAEARLLQRTLGGTTRTRGQALASAVVEARVGDGAQLQFMELQSWADGVYAFGQRTAEVGRDARVHWLLAELGGGLVRSGTRSVLGAIGGGALSPVVFFASGAQHLDLLATMVHQGQRTDGLMLAKGVVSGHGRSVYRGTSEILRGAKGCNSQQKENMLHLSPHARSDAIPALFIKENEVQAGHAATTGKLDEEQLFYLASRGLPRREAERLVVQGFFAPLLERIPVPAVREALVDLVDRKIDGEA